MINLIETPDRKLELLNAQVARIISIGTGWTKLRIGCRMTWSEVAVNPGTCPWYIGVLADPTSGAANGPLMASTSHFVGVENAQPIVRNAGPPVHYMTPSMSRLTKVGSTRVTGSGTSVRWLSEGLRGIYIVDIEKGSPDFLTATVGPHPSTVLSSVAIDMPYEALIGAMEAGLLITGVRDFLNAFTGLTNSYVSGSAATHAVDELTNGFLNSVCVAWGRSYLTCKVSEIVWSKLA